MSIVSTQNTLSTSKTDKQVAYRRLSFVVIPALLVTLYFMLRDSTWTGTSELHTIIEVVATLLALIIGVMALTHYYTHKNLTILFIGAGFIGTAFLDGYHAIVTSHWFAQHFPSGLNSLIPWSWIASRIFLSILLFISWLAWQYQRNLRVANKISEFSVFFIVAIMTLVSFAFFAFVPLPPAYFDDLFFHRPEEFLPAVFFLLALAGYYTKGNWQTDHFEYWLVLCLIVSVVTQVVYMPLSSGLFDIEFNMAHLMKKASYICVLVGLLISMFDLFRMANQHAEEISQTNLKLYNEISSRRHAESERDKLFKLSGDLLAIFDKDLIFIQSNPSWAHVVGYAEHELKGASLLSFIHPDDAPDLVTEFSKTMQASRHSIQLEARIRHDSGQYLWLMWNVNSDPEKQLLYASGRDITGRKEVEQMKNEFISTVSHELRTPLTSIRGSIGLIVGGAVGELPTKAKELLTIAESQSERLVRLINDILDIEKIESGSYQFDFQMYDINELVEQSILTTKAIADQQAIDIYLKERVDHVDVLVDADRLIQVMTNLLSNAIKFTPPEGHIDVYIRRHHNRVKVSVVDYGIGIRTSDHHKIFRKFSQVDGSDARQTGGTGLGLSISKAIIEMHKGIIGFDSEQGKGARFYFDLPIAQTD